MRTARLLCTLVIALAARADVTATLDDYFSRAAAHGFSGAVLVAHGDDIVLRKAYGLADRPAHLAATPETAYNIALLDKQFIAAAILKLEESGKLRTDDRLTRFFDSVPDAARRIWLRARLATQSKQIGRLRFASFALLVVAFDAITVLVVAAVVYA